MTALAISPLLASPLGCIDVSLSDLVRFPTPRKATVAKEVQDTSIGWLRHEYSITASWHRESFWTAITEAEALRTPWELLRQAQDDGEWRGERLDALRKLRFLLWECAYFAGLMPPIVPWWRFFERD